MFRKMRRAEKKAIPNEETIRLLQESKRGVLAVAGDDDYPYAVPVNYYYDAAAGKIYFHSSLAGHKVDAMKRNPKVCFTVYGEPEIKDLDWAPYVKSAVVQSMAFDSFGFCDAHVSSADCECGGRLLAGELWTGISGV